MRIKIIMIGLVIVFKPPNTLLVMACSRFPASCNDAMIPWATVPKSVPRPVIPAVKLPCKDTDSLYSSTGTVVNSPTAMKPLIALRAVSLMLPLPDCDSIPHSKAATTRPTPYSAHAR